MIAVNGVEMLLVSRLSAGFGEYGLECGIEGV